MQSLCMNVSPSASAPALNSSAGNDIRKCTDNTTSYVSSDSKDEQVMSKIIDIGVHRGGGGQAAMAPPITKKGGPKCLMAPPMG